MMHGTAGQLFRQPVSIAEDQNLRQQSGGARQLDELQQLTFGASCGDGRHFVDGE